LVCSKPASIVERVWHFCVLVVAPRSKMRDPPIRQNGAWLFTNVHCRWTPAQP
jgi:hypothetical protein